MAKGKTKTAFFCQECGFESPKWMGQCPACREWNTFVQAPAEPNVLKGYAGKERAGSEKNKPQKLSQISSSDEERISAGIGELNRVLGGGIVAGSLVLVGGDPGIGKSTLLLQMCRELSREKRKVLYVSGEESVKQLKMRADRLGDFSDDLLLMSETSLNVIAETVTDLTPDVLIVDSIQTMYREELDSAPGSVSQVREVTGALLRLAKDVNVSVFVVGHVTKEGVVAGPRVLEHMVDTVLYFEGDNSASTRFLRSVKNRFGSTNEIGVFQMQGDGLAEVLNPSECMLQGKPENAPGSVVTCSLEGTRPILLEVQALICKTSFNMPRRTAAGTDYNRVNLLLAVIEKRLNIRLGECDAYINVAGGIRVNEPALDLGIVVAALSGYRNTVVDSQTACFGEVGLAGEVRAVNMAQQRVTEAAKIGFKRCILPEANVKQMHLSADVLNHMQLVGIKTIHELLGVL